MYRYYGDTADTEILQQTNTVNDNAKSPKYRGIGGISHYFLIKHPSPFFKRTFQIYIFPSKSSKRVKFSQKHKFKNLEFSVFFPYFSVTVLILLEELLLAHLMF